jgi:putative membrane protein
MKILFSILINAWILFLMAYLLAANPDKWIETWITVIWWWKTYLLWWIILWIINVTIRPILKILTIPLFIVFFWLVVFVINAIILKVFDYSVNEILMIQWMSYTINWWINFIIAVAIFTILNMFYSLLFSKK